MEILSQHACRTANKVALSMGYGDTTGRPQARKMIEEAITATTVLLEQIDPVELRNWYEQFQTIFAKTKLESEPVENAASWTQFLATQCDRLHGTGLHQRTIADVGDRMSVWNRNEVGYDSFANALDALAGLVSDHNRDLIDAIDRQSGHDTKSVRRSRLLSLSVIGLTLVLVAIEQATVKGDPRDGDSATLASFGAGLTRSSVDALYQACELSRN